MKNFPILGFGCYRVDYRVEEHQKSLEKAILEGITLIDTSANYADGKSEILVGQVCKKLIDENKIKREDLIVVTKAGYIQGTNYKIASERKAAGNTFPEVVEYGERLWHCIHPDFLAHQIGEQLKRLNMDYVDVYLLHNPEYFLGWAEHEGMKLQGARDEYYRRIKNAFEFLEQKVKEGVIKSYGISSNTFPGMQNDFNFTSLEKVLEIANEVSKENNFKCIQLPFNLIESGAVLNKNQANSTKTVLELAKENNLKVLINRPLNAITAKGLLRLADFEVTGAYVENDFVKQNKLVMMMEQDIIDEKLSDIENSEELEKAKKFLSFGKLIDENWKFFGTLEHFNDNIEYNIAPRINFLSDFFNTKVEDESAKELYAKYLRETYKLFNFISTYYKINANSRNAKIHAVINSIIPEEYHSLSLSQKTMLLIASTEGVSTVLIGARKEKYVDDAAKILNLKKLPEVISVFNKLKSEIADHIN
ncbi:MAG: aldo/keto reductase [Ignavibacteria bacterium]|nr:aldo/keto reductase [Ignavibacteria bacterium]